MWLKQRAGIPTASEFDALISPLGKVRTGQGPLTYVHRKCAEALLKAPVVDFSTFAVEQGALIESEAIPFAKLEYDLPIKRVGFITTDDGRIGCSPDGLIGDDCGIEIKCPQLPTHIEYLLAGALPPEHVAQVQGSMLVTGFSHWRFLSYSRKLPPLMLDVPRDEKFQASLKEALDRFLEMFDAAMNRIKSLKSATPA